MLNVERALQLVIAALVIVGALLLGLGHNNFVLPLFATSAVLVSLLVTDFFRLFFFNRIVANLAAILAAVYSLSDFLISNSERQLFAIASLLIYLQIVLLFQRKTPRLYWQLLVLSLLQVVVAAALYVRVESGLLFGVYLVLALMAMALTYTYHHGTNIRLQSKRTEEELKRRSEHPPSVSDARQFDQKPLLLYDGTHRDRRTLRQMLGTVLLVGCGALTFAAFYFYSIPRMQETWRGPDFSIGGQTGIASRIWFNNQGQIRLSDRVIFRAHFVDPRTSEVLSLEPSVYFRAHVLNYYGRNRGVNNWDYVSPGANQVPLFGQIPEHPSVATMPRLRVVMDPNNETTLYASYPFYRTANTSDELKLRYDSGILLRPQRDQPANIQAFDYELAAGGILDNAQSDVVPYFPFPSHVGRIDGMDPNTRALLSAAKREFQPKLWAKTRNLTSDLDPRDHLAIARRLNDHLLLSGEYRYTLDFSDVPFNTELDAIEDFVVNHKTGHCEYFASALCLMLRHAGIPARVVLGFRCDDFNILANRYVVREENAHAWVEAYLSPEHVTEEMIASGLASEKHGAWLRLDPTPASSEEDGVMTRANDALDLAQMLWDDFVFGYNAERQKSNIYASLFGGGSFFDAVLKGQKMDALLTSTSSALGMSKELTRTLFQVMAGIFLAGGFVASWWLRRMLRKKYKNREEKIGWRQMLGAVVSVISPRLGDWLAGPVDDELRGPKVEFYVRASQLLRKAGFQRSPSQSQGEFFTAVLDQMESGTRRDQLAPILRHLLNAFYSVRFGKQKLSNDQLVKVDQLVSELEKELTGSIQTGTQAT